MESVSLPTMFVTATFDDEHYIENRECDDVQKELKRQFVLFVKRFRSNLERHLNFFEPFKYYAITERGDDGRLHYHFLLFGIPFSTFKSRNKKGQFIDCVQFSEFTECIQDSWGQGFCFFEGACPQNIAYVTKYLHKRLVSPDYVSIKSQGLGLSFLSDNRKEYLHNNMMTKIKIGNKEYYLPRYLKKKIFTDEELVQVNRKIEDEKFQKLMADVPSEFSQNRHYVYYSSTPKLLDLARDLRFGLSKLSDPDASLHDVIFDMNAIRSDFYDYIFEHDVEKDTLLAYPVTEYSLWYSLRKRYFENLKMKNVYNKRL